MQGLSDSMTRPGRFAMQKVEGSSPFIRSKRPANMDVTLLVMTTEIETLSQDVTQPHFYSLTPAASSLLEAVVGSEVNG
jgi:hypothetical protein